jgi:hypothetical protein
VPKPSSEGPSAPHLGCHAISPQPHGIITSLRIAFREIIIVVCHHLAPYTWMSGPSEAPLHLQHSLFPIHPINPRISKYAKRET